MKDFAVATDYTSANIDLKALDIEPNEFQQIDIKKLQQHWEAYNPLTEEGVWLKSQHLELISLVIETDFLAGIEISRRELAKDHQDPEDVLGKEH